MESEIMEIKLEPIEEIDDTYVISLPMNKSDDEGQDIDRQGLVSFNFIICMLCG